MGWKKLEVYNGDYYIGSFYMQCDNWTKKKDINDAINNEYGIGN